MKKLVLALCLLVQSYLTFAQELFPGQQDSLRGSITPERSWWDLTHYDLKVSIDPGKKFIEGSNTITYRVLDNVRRMQIDLQPPMKILKAEQDGLAVSVDHMGNAHFLNLPPQQKGELKEVTIWFSGYPKEAINAPWDGGFSWARDRNGNPFVATSCQGLGASVWWPNKDHMYDEADSMQISLTVPKALTAVANGQLKNTSEQGDTHTFVWEVLNPINNYGVNANVGDYVHFKDSFQGERGNLKMDFYVLSYELERAKKQFVQAKQTLEAFEHWFGPYPFYEDGYKLVEVPYLGMEHQSSVTYGNKYTNGYLGSDLSGTGYGLLFDFIIIHESGHEWFANNITNRDIADMWIHESFTAYSESLFLEYFYGKEAAYAYVTGTRNMILNDKPIIGQYDVNMEGSSDMYYKGANMLHSLRQWVNNDTQWRAMLRGLNEEFYHQTVTTEQVENYISEFTGLPLKGFFDQYLRTIQTPELQYRVNGKILEYRYQNIVPGFQLPVRVQINGSSERLIQPAENWQKLDFGTPITSVKPDANLLIHTLNIKN